jgi:hypothetical protein
MRNERRISAIKHAAQYRSFLDNNIKQFTIICSPGVKHVWELEGVTSNTYCNIW